eukprot:6203410-Pleurochrysis_carterae.AAC.1
MHCAQARAGAHTGGAHSQEASHGKSQAALASTHTCVRRFVRAPARDDDADDSFAGVGLVMMMIASQARDVAPSIIVIDEVDAVGATRNSDAHSSQATVSVRAAQTVARARTA